MYYFILHGTFSDALSFISDISNLCPFFFSLNQCGQRLLILFIFSKTYFRSLIFSTDSVFEFTNLIFYHFFSFAYFIINFPFFSQFPNVEAQITDFRYSILKKNKFIAINFLVKVKVKSLNCIQLFATNGLQPTRLLCSWAKISL